MTASAPEYLSIIDYCFCVHVTCPGRLGAKSGLRLKVGPNSAPDTKSHFWLFQLKTEHRSVAALKMRVDRTQVEQRPVHGRLPQVQTPAQNWTVRTVHGPLAPENVTGRSYYVLYGA